MYEGKKEIKPKKEAFGNWLIEDIKNIVNAAEGEHILQGSRWKYWQFFWKYRQSF